MLNNFGQSDTAIHFTVDLLGWHEPQLLSVRGEPDNQPQKVPCVGDHSGTEGELVHFSDTPRSGQDGFDRHGLIAIIGPGYKYVGVLEAKNIEPESYLLAVEYVHNELEERVCEIQTGSPEVEKIEVLENKTEETIKK